jgi:hypothetical protein
MVSKEVSLLVHKLPRGAMGSQFCSRAAEYGWHLHLAYMSWPYDRAEGLSELELPRQHKGRVEETQWAL